jgi:hypothetical protein
VGARSTDVVYFLVMEIAVLVVLVIAVIAVALVTRGRFRRSWDDTDAWDAVKRVGEEASKESGPRGTRST